MVELIIINRLYVAMYMHTSTIIVVVVCVTKVNKHFFLE